MGLPGLLLHRVVVRSSITPCGCQIFYYLKWLPDLLLHRVVARSTIAPCGCQVYLLWVEWEALAAWIFIKLFSFSPVMFSIVLVTVGLVGLRKLNFIPKIELRAGTFAAPSLAMGFIPGECQQKKEETSLTTAPSLGRDQLFHLGVVTSTSGGGGVLRGGSRPAVSRVPWGRARAVIIAIS